MRFALLRALVGICCCLGIFWGSGCGLGTSPSPEAELKDPQQVARRFVQALLVERDARAAQAMADPDLAPALDSLLLLQPEFFPQSPQVEVEGVQERAGGWRVEVVAQVDPQAPAANLRLQLEISAQTGRIDSLSAQGITYQGQRVII